MANPIHDGLDVRTATKRLAFSGPTTAIKAEFYVGLPLPDWFSLRMVADRLQECKVAALALAECNPPSESRLLRDCAFWYLQILPADLDLNEDSFTARQYAATAYLPLCWTQFGEPKGIHLRAIVGISVTCSGRIRGIPFHYTGKEVPAKYRKLGHC